MILKVKKLSYPHKNGMSIEKNIISKMIIRFKFNISSQLLLLLSNADISKSEIDKYESSSFAPWKSNIIYWWKKLIV